MDIKAYFSNTSFYMANLLAEIKLLFRVEWQTGKCEDKSWR